MNMTGYPIPEMRIAEFENYGLGLSCIMACIQSGAGAKNPCILTAFRRWNTEISWNGLLPTAFQGERLQSLPRKPA